MAKGKSGKRTTRETSYSLPSAVRSFTPTPAITRLPEFEPRPNSKRDLGVAKTTSGKTAVVTVRSEPKKGRAWKHRAPTLLHFEAPLKTLVCIARKMRREVLFAKKKSGRGHKRPKWKPHSHIRC